VKTAIVAMLLAVVGLSTASIAAPTPAAAGWCYEACGIKRPPPPRTRTTTCTTYRGRGYSETQCTSTSR
jgi:hypothetical protein